MAGFLMKQMVGSKINEVVNLGGGGDAGIAGEKAADEDPEVIAARQEMEEKRKEKHRRMELEREKMRGDIRSKYNLHRKEENAVGSSQMGLDDGRMGAGRKKTPEELVAEMQANEETLIGQLGLTEQVETAKKAVNNAFETVKGFLPFGK